MKFNWTIFLNILRNIYIGSLLYFVCFSFFSEVKRDRKILKFYVKYFHEIIS